MITFQPKKSSILLFGLVLILLEVIVVASIILGVRLLYASIAFGLAVELLIISRYRYDILLYGCFLVFILSQFQSTLFDLGRWLFLGLVCVASIYTIGKIKLSVTPVVVGLGLISIYSILTSIISYYPSISLLKGVSLLLFAAFLALVVPAVKRLYPNIGVKNYFLKMYLIFSIGIVVSNAIFFLFMPSQSILGERYRGWFLNPNGIGAFYGIFFIPILVHEYIQQKPGLGRISLLFVLVLAIVEWLASQSRAGILAGTTAVSILILGRRKLQVRTILILTLVLIISTLVISSPSNNIFRQFIYRNEETLLGSGRLPIWISTWNRFLEHPFLGSGLGVSDTGLRPGGVAFNTSGYTIEKGNSYLGTLEELGLVGFIIFSFSLLLPLLYSSWKYFESDKLISNRTDHVLIAIMAAGLINAMFEAWVFSVGSILCFAYWLLATLLFAPDNS